MIIKTNKLTWDKKSRSFVGEGSTLGIPPGKWYKILVLESSNTGKQLYFSQYKKLTDMGGELVGWKYLNKETGITCTVLND